VLAEQSGGVLLVTFDGVESWSVPARPNPSTLQFQLDLASGVITIVLVAVDGDTTSPFGSAWLVGVTAPGASQDPGAVALAAGPWTSADPETRALELAATSRPLLGTHWLLELANVPPTAVFGIDVFGATDPGLADLAALGLPGCGLRASPDVLYGWTPAGATHGYTLAVPLGGALLGFDVFTTSAVLQVPPQNAFGGITANGVQGRVGDV
jgi:hypothetical protein